MPSNRTIFKKCCIEEAPLLASMIMAMTMAMVSWYRYPFTSSKSPAASEAVPFTDQTNIFMIQYWSSHPLLSTNVNRDNIFQRSVRAPRVSSQARRYQIDHTAEHQWTLLSNDIRLCSSRSLMLRTYVAKSNIECRTINLNACVGCDSGTASIIYDATPNVQIIQSSPDLGNGSFLFTVRKECAGRRTHLHTCSSISTPR